jgi:hypothetical protein
MSPRTDSPFPSDESSANPSRLNHATEVSASALAERESPPPRAHSALRSVEPLYDPTPLSPASAPHVWGPIFSATANSNPARRPRRSGTRWPVPSPVPGAVHRDCHRADLRLAPTFAATERPHTASIRRICAVYALATLYRRQVPETPLSSWSPSSLSSMSEPAITSATVRETNTLPAPAWLETRLPM